MKIQSILLLLALVSSAYSQLAAALLNNNLVLQKFYQFQIAYNIKYESPQVEAFRFKVFQENLQYIQGQENLGLTKFMDLTNQEFTYKYLNFIPEQDYTKYPDLNQQVSLNDDDQEQPETAKLVEVEATKLAEVAKLTTIKAETAKAEAKKLAENAKLAVMQAETARINAEKLTVAAKLATASSETGEPIDVETAQIATRQAENAKQVQDQALKQAETAKAEAKQAEIQAAKLVETAKAAVQQAEVAKLTVSDTNIANIISALPKPLLPPYIDWQQLGKVTSVKNQLGCYAGWAFSAIGAIESAFKIQNSWYNNPDLSEQELLSCSSSYGNNGCQGGTMVNAFQYIRDHQIAVEQQFPYTGNPNIVCHTTNIRHFIQSYATIPTNSCLSLLWQLQNRPISVAVNAQNWQFYTGNGTGVFSNCPQNVNVNHGVLLVGYVNRNGKRAYKVKNSWGTNWGISGYIYLDVINQFTGNLQNTCGICSAASYPIL